jgi:hypothetical protein
VDIRYLRPVGRPVKDKHSCYCKVMTVKGPWRRDGYMKPIECFLLSEEYAPSLPDQMSKPLRVLNLCDCSRNPDGCVCHILASLSCYPRDGSNKIAMARRLIENKLIISIFQLSPSVLLHRQRFATFANKVIVALYLDNVAWFGVNPEPLQYFRWVGYKGPLTNSSALDSARNKTWIIARGRHIESLY